MADQIRPYMNLDGFYNAIKITQEDLGELHKLLSSLNEAARMVGGAMPPEPFNCNIAGITPLDKSLTEKAFLRQMKSVDTKNKYLLDRVLAYGRIAKQLKTESESIDNKIDKLKERARNQSAGAEHDTAKRLISKFEESKVVTDARLKIVLSKALESRKQMLGKVVRLTSAIMELFPDGDPMLRELFNKYSTSSLTDSMVILEDKMRMGFKPDDRKTVKI